MNIPVKELPLTSTKAASGTAFAILISISICHTLNDTVQSLLPAIYPMLKQSFQLDFGQIGLITFAFQMTASILQPFVGLYTDYRPKPYSLPVGMALSLCGLLLLSVAPTYGILLLAAALIGTGSSIFHPESSRVARVASGGRHGLAQSVFQVGGNFGSALGPLLAAFIVVPHGQSSVAWFSVLALAAIVILWRVSLWYDGRRKALGTKSLGPTDLHVPLPKRRVVFALTILGILVFSKHFYLTSISSYYTFYLIEQFGISIQSAQLHLFLFLLSAAAGTVIGGPIGDRFGRKVVIWVSILGVLPFTLALPFANLFWTSVLSVLIGLILSSAFSTIVVFGQELVPGKVGLVSGIFFGLAFGIGGIGAALLGQVADATSIQFVYHLCSFLPAIGLLTVFLPNMKRRTPALKPA